MEPEPPILPEESAESHPAEAEPVVRQEQADEARVDGPTPAEPGCSQEPDEQPLPAAAPSAALCTTPRTAPATACKRKEYDFRCRFSQTVAFKSFFENLGNVLAEVTLEVRSAPGDFAGIVADSMDPSSVTLVHGKIAGQVELNVPLEQAIFCITIKDVLDIFPNIHPQHFVEIYRVRGCTDITMHIFEPSLRASNFQFRIQTLDKSIDTLELNDMHYSYYVEVELNAFKNALKTAKNQAAESIQLLIYETEEEAAEQGQRSIFFVIRYRGIRTSVSFPYESKVLMRSSEDGPLQIKAIEHESSAGSEDACDQGMQLHDRLEELEPTYQGSFLSRYIFQFVKSMERSNITLRLARDKPLIIDYPLGCSSTDGLRFVLAPTAPGLD